MKDPAPGAAQERDAQGQRTQEQPRQGSPEPAAAGGGAVPRDTRREARTALELPVLVDDPSNRAEGGIRFESSEVSVGGAFLPSDLLFEVGEVLALRFQLPDGRDVHARARVARVSRDARTPGGTATRGARPGMGIEFVDLSPDDRAAIEARLHT